MPDETLDGEGLKADRREYQRAYYQANKEAILAAQHRYYEKNKEKVSERTRRWREKGENRQKDRERSRRYYYANKEELDGQRVQRQKKSPEEIAAKNQEYYQQWYEANREARNQRRKEKREAQSKNLTALLDKQQNVRRRLLSQARAFLTMREASEWLDQPEQRQEFGISQAPKPDTLKKMTQVSPPRLLAVKKGDVLLTNEPALRLMMATYVETGGRKASKVRRQANQ